MTLIEIENLPYSEIKSRRDELTDAAQSTDTRELAARYVKTLESAKHRDEKLGEQGVTIGNLNDALGIAKQRCVDLEKVVQDASAELLKQREYSAEQAKLATAEQDRLLAQIDELSEKLAAKTALADRMKVQALRNNAAVAEAAAVLNKALLVQQVENAEVAESTKSAEAVA